MKEDVLDVLLYLFDYCEEMTSDKKFDEANATSLLREAGFGNKEIYQAFDWLQDLHLLSQYVLKKKDNDAPTMRVYLPLECYKIDVEARGFLLFLEQMGILDTMSRELVIDRAMALELDEISLEHMKWIIIMVLFNQDEGLSPELLEEVVFDDYQDIIH